MRLHKVFDTIVVKMIQKMKNNNSLPDSDPCDGIFCIHLRLDKCKGFRLESLAPRTSRRGRIEPYEVTLRHLETSHIFRGCWSLEEKKSGSMKKIPLNCNIIISYCLLFVCLFASRVGWVLGPCPGSLFA